MPTELPPAPPGALRTRKQIEQGRRKSSMFAHEVARCWGLLAPLPCGHPAACAMGKTTRYCGWCADRASMARYFERAERLKLACDSALAARLPSRLRAVIVKALMET